MSFDYSKERTEDLAALVTKRQVGLIVMGMNITGTKKIPTEREEAFRDRISNLIGAAEELTKRKQQVHFDLTKQHPLVRERIITAIKQSTLLRTLPAPKKRLPKPKTQVKKRQTRFRRP